ncbi:MAG: hypothetical protein IID36_05085 [Planctomycetes bacterium]|nr:hypothetical protein [Planctomycetota bacterium]
MSPSSSPSDAPATDIVQGAVSTVRPSFDDHLLLTEDEAAHARFCFLGEFGYELVSWIPYLLFLRETLGIRLRTLGRPGSSVIYYFSNDHVEVDSSYIGGCWGDPLAYARLADLYPTDLLVCPGRQSGTLVNRRRIEVGGHRWTTVDIHRSIDETNYVKPDYSHIQPWSPIAGLAIVVINNKYLVQWEDRYHRPINFFDPDALRSLRDLFLENGYGVVYNHFVEQTAIDDHLALADTELFGIDDATFDMRAIYADCASPAERNERQISLYNSADLVVAPQGGNVYIPAICGRHLCMIMRDGDYLDYLELARLYDIDLDVFYEPRHMLTWLAAWLSNGDRA